MKKIITLFAFILTSSAFAQTAYSPMSWGLNKGVTPYAFGANINGTWRDLGTVSAAGVWSIPSSNLSFTQSGAGAVSRTVNSKLTDSVSVLDFGADATGTTNSTTAINNALAAAAGRVVYVPPGTYRLDNMVTVPSGGILECSGRATTTFAVNSSTFNMGANGVVTISFGDASEIRSCGISFVQPNTATRANIIQYPPAIYAVGATRFRLQDVRVSSAYTCLNATANTGGSLIDNFECGAFATSNTIAFDGALDFIHINRLECWPFGFSGTSNLMSIYNDQTTNCMSIGLVDGFAADTISTLSASIVLTANAAGTGIPFQFSNIQLDVNSAFIVNAGRAYVSNLYATRSTTALYPAVSATAPGAQLEISQFDEWVDGSTICNVSATNGGQISINGGRTYHLDTASAVGCVSGAGSLLFVNNLFANVNPTNRTVALFTQTSNGQLQVKGTTFGGSGGATGSVISFQQDLPNNAVQNILANGWAVTLPATTTAGRYEVFDTGIVSNSNLMRLVPRAIAALPTCNAISLGSVAVVNDGVGWPTVWGTAAAAVPTGFPGTALVGTGAVIRSVICTNTAGATTYAWAYN